MTLAEALSGLVLGLGLIMPIGAQNLFIIQQGISLGYPRFLHATLATTCCDALMIAVGALGLGAVFQNNDTLRTVLLVAGSGYLLYLAVQGLRASAEHLEDTGSSVSGPRATVVRAAGVSLLNPHAVLDTVGVLGAVAATHSGLGRLAFALGAVLASLLWFTFLGGAASAVRNRLTPRVRRIISICSSLVMAGFAVMLCSEVLAELHV
ncbi:LysE/ArgO family amino acid transporter [Streptomyces sp. NPDC001514]